MLVDANCQQEFADSSCLVLQGRWDLRSSPKTTAGEKNMVAPLTQELLNSNPSLSSKLQCLWIYTKQNICQRGDLYRGTDTSCVVHVQNFCYSFLHLCLWFLNSVFVKSPLDLTYLAEISFFVIVAMKDQIPEVSVTSRKHEVFCLA